MTGPDHVALLPAYLAGATVVLVLLTDALLARRGVVIAVTALGAVVTGAAAYWVGTGPTRTSFCGAKAPQDCSYVADSLAAVVAVLFAGLTLGVLALSVPALRSPGVPAGEYCFLLACSMTGGVVLGYAGDLVSLIVALETLTLPLYLLVGLRRGSVASAEGAITFFVVSVVATAVTLLGAALLYAVTGALHFGLLSAAFAADAGLADQPLATVAVTLVIVGLSFKVAAVPFHAWAPAAYDGAPLPVAAYLSTASKLGGVVALLYVTVDALPPERTGPVLALLAVLTMTVGNLVALRQTRMVRLLAWSSVAQAGYILAPLGAAAVASGRTPDALALAVTATVAYAVFYVVMELAAFAAVVALRPTGGDGGTLDEYRGVARRAPWVGAAFVLALVGLAGLPPGLAGLFAKVTVVRSLLGGGAGWLAVVVALNAVVGLAYYVRVAASLYAHRAAEGPRGPQPAEIAAGEPVGVGPSGPAPAAPALSWPVAATLGVATLVAIVVGFAPQLVLDAASLAQP
ncbi:MAG TPA: NADH-quinone oxidoreductase subunit N [Pilimelia sp.]|nr:NADH-quinone oxidoreductase subunit N [Pilimelia sp.]